MSFHIIRGRQLGKGGSTDPIRSGSKLTHFKGGRNQLIIHKGRVLNWLLWIKSQLEIAL